MTWDVTESPMTEVVKYWFSEENQVKDEDISPEFKFRDAAVHFTQLAWANTDQIGCGWTQYVDESEEHPYISLVVCNYYTTGNSDLSLVHRIIRTVQEMWKEGQCGL